LSNLSLFIVPDSFTFPSFVYAVTPDQPDTAVLLAQVEAALQGGVRLVQYRDKISAMPAKLQRARRLKQLCQAHGALLLINDDIVLAIAAQADGIHLGATDGSLRDARRLLPAKTIIGASCYNDLPLARQAIADGASYVAFGACFASTTKPAARRVSPTQLAMFRQALGSQVAICGIGGITLDNVAQLDDQVDAVALISELFGTPEAPASPDQIRHRVSQFLAEPIPT